MAGWHRFGIALGLTALVGCGSPAPEAPMSGPTPGSAAAGVSAPAGQAPPQPSPLGLTARPASPPGALITDDPRAPSPTQDARAQPVASPATTQAAAEQALADQAQRAARQRWYAEAREHPEGTVRLQALETWAQQPSSSQDALDPLTYALVDGDESVRARAQELWAQQLQRETATTQRVQEAGPGGPATP